jgi:putative two-component system response regulator
MGSKNTKPTDESKQLPPKVLIIDADRSRLDELAAELSREGFRVIPCTSARGALGKIRQELPDAVVLEVILPTVSGFEIAARMQADRRLSRIPIFFTTDIQNSDGGNSDYFARPLEMPALIRALRKRIAAAPSA